MHTTPHVPELSCIETVAAPLSAIGTSPSTPRVFYGFLIACLCVLQHEQVGDACNTMAQRTSLRALRTIPLQQHRGLQMHTRTLELAMRTTMHDTCKSK